MYALIYGRSSNEHFISIICCVVLFVVLFIYKLNIECSVLVL